MRCKIRSISRHSVLNVEFYFRKDMVVNHIRKIYYSVFDKFINTGRVIIYVLVLISRPIGTYH